MSEWLIRAAAAPGPVTVQVCAASYAGDCCAVFQNTIEVKFCPGAGGANDFYVYKLKNVPVCDMAYCAVGGYDESNGTDTCKYFSVLVVVAIKAYYRYLIWKKGREMRSVRAYYVSVIST